MASSRHLRDVLAGHVQTEEGEKVSDERKPVGCSSSVNVSHASTDHSSEDRTTSALSNATKANPQSISLYLSFFSVIRGHCSLKLLVFFTFPSSHHHCRLPKESSTGRVCVCGFKIDKVINPPSHVIDDQPCFKKPLFHCGEVWVCSCLYFTQKCVKITHLSIAALVTSQGDHVSFIQRFMWLLHEHF